MFPRDRVLRAVVAPAAVLLAGVLSAGSGVVTDTSPAPALPVAHAPDVVVPVPVLMVPGDDTRVTPTGTPLFRISATSRHDLPKAAKRAYVHAAKQVEAAKPGCGIYWELLAGIGRVESDHGRFDDAVLGTDGVSKPLIRGIALDGKGPVAAIADTDRGKLDDDVVWDRAVGPLQFIPSSWKTYGQDGDGDGVADPDDLDDAALAAADYLCTAGGDLSGVAAMRTAVFAYNHSDYYVDLVLAFAVGYHTGVFDIPPPPPPPVEPTEQPTEAPTDTPTEQPTATPAKQPPAQPTEQPTEQPAEQPTTPPPGQAGNHNGGNNSGGNHGTGGNGGHQGGGNGGNGGNQPAPDPEPAPVKLASENGPWTTCGGWCLTGSMLDLGPSGQVDAGAAADFDGDGVVETNRAEFDGLVGQVVGIEVARGTNVVYTINGGGYRNADGSFSRP